MHVEEGSIFDSVYNAADLKAAVAGASDKAKENLQQIAAISSICNDASFESTNEKLGDRKIKGNATDAAILNFSDAVGSSDDYRSAWREVFKQSFNSKVIFHP
jgi:sodium/potassium-transporting ATPase subunit alpha